MRILFMICLVSLFASKVCATRFTLPLFEKENFKKNSLAAIFQRHETSDDTFQLTQEPTSLFDMGEDVPLSRVEEFAASLLETRWIFGIAQVFSRSLSEKQLRMGASFRMDLNDKEFQLRYSFNF